MDAFTGVSAYGRRTGLVTEFVPPKQNWLRPADAPTTKRLRVDRAAADRFVRHALPKDQITGNVVDGSVTEDIDMDSKKSDS